MAHIPKPRDLDAMLAERRSRSSPVRDLTNGVDREKTGGRVFRTPLGWLWAVIAQILVLIAIITCFLVVPPLLTCNSNEQRGFFVGETLASCTSQGISTRMHQFDQQVRQLILGSGK